MTRPTDATSGARFNSPLSLWIAIWQRQLVHGQFAVKKPADASRGSTPAATVAEAPAEAA
jgi:hypothetical protein